jgi:hypothetical protein
MTDKPTGFTLYCKTLTDAQLMEVLRRERDGMARDPDRVPDYHAARAEAYKRGLV